MPGFAYESKEVRASTFEALADCFFQLGDNQLALENCKKALEEDASCITVHATSAFAYVALENLTDVEQQCREFPRKAGPLADYREPFAFQDGKMSLCLAETLIEKVQGNIGSLSLEQHQEIIGLMRESIRLDPGISEARKAKLANHEVYFKKRFGTTP